MMLKNIFFEKNLHDLNFNFPRLVITFYVLPTYLKAFSNSGLVKAEDPSE